jgi:transglutaminase-like putative cysteine protease
MRFELKRPTGPPEDSIPMRVVVALAVEVAIAAVVAQHAVRAPIAVAALVLAPLGYLFSYRRRHKGNLALKLVITVALLAATGQFLASVRLATNVDAARIPLATLFLWVQVLHAFDVPRRRDLAFSMISSLILVAEAGALSLTTSFVWFLVPWAGLAGTWLYLSSRPRPDKVAAPVSVRRLRPDGRGRRTAPVRAVAVPATAAVLGAFLVFLAMPRVPGSFVKAPPFSLQNATPLRDFDGGVQNPGLASQAGDGVVDFSPDAYPGFSDVVDLRARGRLSDEIAFRVRAPQAALWRAETFDTYDGTLWTMADDRTEPVDQGFDTGSYEPRRDAGQAATLGTNEVTQTFYIDSPQPNVLFAAANARTVYFPSGGLKVDRSGSIRSPIALDEGLVYSVVSDVPVNDPGSLRLSNRAVPPTLAARYLQLPASLPSRVGALARQITAGLTNDYDRAGAIETWLRTNTVYDLNVPRDPDGVDAVDHFLFETRRGFCEHIASSMAVMLRSIGIPARLVTGYGPGERNAFTGYFEVKQSDAHAWVEVYYAGHGWVAYDPTFGVPAAVPGVASRFMAGPVFAAIGRFLGATPEPIKAVARGAGRAIVLAGRGALASWPFVSVGAVLAALVAAFTRRRRRIRALGPPPTGAEAAFEELRAALAEAGHDRDPSETPSEYLASVAADPALAEAVVEAAELVVRIFERARFAPEDARPSEADVVRARAAAAHVAELV